ncbi:hypothetical protein OHA25_37300 [Nonomuraea sp. NBC_00507]
MGASRHARAPPSRTALSGRVLVTSRLGEGWHRLGAHHSLMV